MKGGVHGPKAPERTLDGCGGPFQSESWLPEEHPASTHPVPGEKKAGFQKRAGFDLVLMVEIVALV